MKFQNKHTRKTFAAKFVAAVIVASSSMSATAVFAQSQTTTQFEFNIAAQSLSEALAAFAVQSGIQVSANGNLVRGLNTGGIKGRMNAEEALRTLIAGSGLLLEMTPSGAVIKSANIQSDASEQVVEPIVVNEAAESDRHAGSADRQDSKYISSVDLKRRNPTSLKKVFAGESAVSVGGGVPMAQKVYVRGVEEKNLSVTIDGARQKNNNFHHTGTTLIDPSLLKSVRVDPSVAPADAGPGAIAGSIVFETVDADDILSLDKDFGGFATVSYDTNSGTIANSNSIVGRKNGFEALGFFKWAKGDDYEAGNGEVAVGSGTKLLSWLGKTGFESKSGHRLEFSGEYVLDDTDRPYRANLQNITNRDNPAERVYDLKRRNFTFNYENKEASGLFDPRATLAYAASDLYVPSDYYSGLSSSFSGKIENDFHLSDKDKITAGVDFYQDETMLEHPTERRLKESAVNIGLFGQARIEPIENVNLSFGARGDRQSFEGHDGTDSTFQGLSGNSSIAYEVIEGVTLKGGYSKVYGGVSLSEAFIYNSAWDYASSKVEPTRSDNYSVGIETEYKGLTFDGALFRSNVDNARKATYNGGPGLKADFKTNGYELGLGYNWKDGFAKISFSDTQIKVGGNYGNTFSAQDLGAPLGKVIAFEIEQNLDDLGVSVGGSVDMALKSKDPLKSSSSYAVQKGYTVLNLYSEYRPNFADYISVRFEANNILDRTYTDRATYGQEFSTVEPTYEPGRSFLLSARVDF